MILTKAELSESACLAASGRQGFTEFWDLRNLLVNGVNAGDYPGNSYIGLWAKFSIKKLRRKTPEKLFY